MRLIDADKIDFSKAFGGHSEFAKDLIAVAQGLIDMQPTAFYKENVIEKLKQNRDIAECNVEKAMAYDIAIAIVENGGIE